MYSKNLFQFAMCLYLTFLNFSIFNYDTFDTHQIHIRGGTDICTEFKNGILVIGKEGYPRSIRQVLGNLGSQSSTGNRLLFQLFQSGKLLVIVDPSLESVEDVLPTRLGYVKEWSKDYGIIFFDLSHSKMDSDRDNGFEGQSIKNRSESVMAHEIVHHLLPERIQRGWLYLDPKHGNPVSIPASEVIAVQIENMVREEMGLSKKRTHYEGLNVFEKSISFFEKSGYEVCCYLTKTIDLDVLNTFDNGTYRHTDILENRITPCKAIKYFNKEIRGAVRSNLYHK